jgi:small subunit ribosomal protein S21
LPRIVSRNMSFEKALRIFRKKVDSAGIKDELRRREFYEKPTNRRRRKLNESKRRNLSRRRKENAMWDSYRRAFQRKR